ncbi:DUF63 family protein [Pyrococcus abyssi]|uniref:Uncharacterized protein n=1 Tax=Pyrococcus abyssi (strain GE5 / Orsay) TaxID=272844 RepID=Q9V2E7_PYRAB|nr:DUF63 family protein [Pyrococcus abyssi]CAB49051.1 Membrane protein, unknown function. DUF63 family [Pyrococcus abyssi GE5]CCE69503.1 TPA: hypothetical protein PAB0078 [Pyrococcus abyssi GE5]
MDVHQFLWEYFIRPMYTREGYNPINTVVYALIFGFAVIYTYKYVIKPLKIKVDERLFLAVTPMVIFGSTVRALVDGGILKPNPWILTPGIFFTAFFLILPALFLDVKLKLYPKLTIAWGTLLAGYANYLLIINAKCWKPYELTLLHTLVSFVVVFAFYKVRPFERLYLYPVLAHYFDIASTVVAIHFYSYMEVHWVERHLVNAFGAYAYYPWITVILFLVYYILRNMVPDGDERNYWYLAIYILGLGPAIRDPAQMVLQIACQ